MNGHRAYLDLSTDFRNKAHNLSPTGHRTYTNVAPFRRARILEETDEQGQ